MADKTRAVFVRTLAIPIKLGGKIVNPGEQYVGNYDAINGLPGMQFIGFEDEMRRGNKTVIVKDDSMEIIVESEEVYELKKQEVKETKVEESKTFTPERLKELKEIKPKGWLGKKKSEFIEILEEGGIDYSAVKDDRMALYRFLVDVLSNM